MVWPFLVRSISHFLTDLIYFDKTVRRKRGFLLTVKSEMAKTVRNSFFERLNQMGKEQIMKEFLTQEHKRLETVRMELEKCPRGLLYQQTKGKKTYYIQSYYEKGQQIHKGISSEPELVIGLIKRELLEKELKSLENNEKQIEACLKNIQNFQLYTEIEKLQKRCPSVTEEMVSEALKPKTVSAWEQEEFEQSNYKVEERRQRTRRGLKVRSKSELLIAESLYEYSLPFRYEQILYIQDKAFAPDFTILKADGTLVYWEHFGLTNTKEYLEHQMYKLRMYASKDIVPWKNLIITYDDPSGNVDLRIIRAEIENKLMSS